LRPFVKNRHEVWKLWVVATSFDVRPSAVVGIENTWTAYCFDSAVRMFGVWVENKLSERTNLRLPKHDLENLLQGKLGRSKAPSQFANVASLIALEGIQ